jgi:hypothetical protein
VRLLQPLEVPSQVWADISMDYIEGLRKVRGKSVILTVVNRFSKYAHFIALSHPYTASSIARTFFDGQPSATRLPDVHRQRSQPGLHQPHVA